MRCFKVALNDVTHPILHTLQNAEKFLNAEDETNDASDAEEDAMYDDVDDEGEKTAKSCYIEFCFTILSKL